LENINADCGLATELKIEDDSVSDIGEALEAEVSENIQAITN